MTDRYLLNIVYNTAQSGDQRALHIPTADLQDLCERGLIQQFCGSDGGQYFMVTDAGQAVLKGGSSSR